MKPERLEQIRARLNATTPGPWEAWQDTDNRNLHEVFSAADVICEENLNHSEPSIADFQFIAHSWEDIRDLLDEVERLHDIIADPVAVWVNMLRGTIAKPEGLAEAERRAAAAEAEVERLREFENVFGATPMDSDEPK